MDIKTSSFVIQMVPVDDIKISPFNPLPRTEPAALRDLLMQIRDVGIMSPLMVADDGYLADGHRRLACAKILGITHVPVRRVVGTAAEWYHRLNDGGRPLTGKEWAESVARGLPIESVARRHRPDIAQLYSLLGEEDFRDLFANRRVAPHILSIAKRIGVYIDDSSGEMLRAIVLWLEKHNSQKMARDAMDGEINPYDLMRAVIEDRRIRNQWGVE